MSKPTKYIPALSFGWLTPLYDPFLKWGMREETFKKPRSVYARLISLVMRRLEEAADNIQGLLPGMIRSAGLAQVEETAQYTTIVGGLSLFRAKK